MKKFIHQLGRLILVCIEIVVMIPFYLMGYFWGLISGAFMRGYRWCHIRYAESEAKFIQDNQPADTRPSSQRHYPTHGD